MKPCLPLIGALLLIAAVVCRAQDQAPPAQAAPSVTPHEPILKRLFSVRALAATVPGAILQQVHDWPEEWGRQRSGFEKRIGSLYGQFVVGILIEDGVKAVHHEDTRYRRLG